MFTVLNARGPLSPFGLAQEEAPAAEPIEIDRLLAGTTQKAIADIEKAAAEDQSYQQLTIPWSCDLF